MRVWIVLSLLSGIISTSYAQLRPISQERTLWATLTYECCTLIGCQLIERAESESATDFGVFDPFDVSAKVACCPDDALPCTRPVSYATHYSNIQESGLEAAGSISAYSLGSPATCGSRFRVEFDVTVPSRFSLDASVMATTFGSQDMISGRIALVGSGIRIELESNGEEATLHENGPLPAGRYVIDATIALNSADSGRGNFSLQLDISPTSVQGSTWQFIKRLYQ